MRNQGALVLQIREASDDDLPQVMQIHRAAFGQETEAELVQAILADPGAAPALSLLASEAGHPLGHILFSRARLSPPRNGCSAVILAPLAVVPGAQGRGLGSSLVEAGLARLEAAGTALVFVFGDPAYYGRFGFAPALPRALQPPYPLPDAYLLAWQVRDLRNDSAAAGTVVCCEALMRPELWRE